MTVVGLCYRFSCGKSSSYIGGSSFVHSSVGRQYAMGNRRLARTRRFFIEPRQRA